MTDSLEIRLAGEIVSGRDLRGAIATAGPSIAKVMDEFEQDERPYALELDIDGPDVDEQATLADLADASLRALNDVWRNSPEQPYATRFLTGMRVRRSRGAAEPGMKLSLRAAGNVAAEPAGILLIDVPGPPTMSAREMTTSTAAIRDSLASNVMARPDAEYALAVDLPSGDAGLEGTTSLNKGLTLARLLAGVLPAEEPGRPNLLELWVGGGQVAPDDLTPRIRVWRLGIMKIRSHSRVA